MDWSEHYAGESGYRRWPGEELVRFMSTQPPHGTWLEAGCGGGGNLAAMRGRGREVVGVDAHLPALQVARIGHSPVAAADIFRLPFADATFDGVVDSMVSQHVRSQDHVRLYREYRRVLKRAGRLWIYHLDADTDCHSQHLVLGGDAFEWCELSLFPTVPFFCLPPPAMLRRWIETAGFHVRPPSFSRRKYGDGQVANYAIFEAVAQ